MKVNYYCFFVSLFFCMLSFAQEIEVRGNVAVKNGEPLPGASIIIEGTSTGTQTDFDGNFSLYAKNSAVLLISYVGFKSQKIKVTTTPIQIILEEDADQLEEVIVTGYTEKAAKKITSSIATINGEQIANVPMATFDNILQGAAPGLLVQSGTGQPGRAASLNIRGIKSINSSSQPLYILDGIEITSGDFAGINPNDIESVSVLKDAAATQIYGSRGATGVLVITTRSGKRGKTQIEYHTLFGISPAPKYNDGLRPLTSEQLINLQQEIGIGAARNLPQSQIDELKTINTDWLDVLTRDATIQTHELNFSGGGEHTRFYISGSYFSQEGTALRSKLDRYSLRSKIDYSKDRLSIGSNVFLSYSKIEDSESEGVFGRSNPFYSSIRANPYDRDRDPITGEFADPLDLSASSTQNILERILTNDEDRSIGKAIVSLNGRYKFAFLEGLSFTTRWSMDFSQRNRRTYVDPSSVAGGRSRGGQGELEHIFEERVRFTGTNSFHYDFDIDDDHEFNVGLYQEYVYFEGNEVALEVYGLNQITTISGATQGSETNGFIPTFDGSTSKNALSSYFTTLDYSFRNRYNLTAGARRDGSSRFGENNRFGNFYSVGLGWIVSEEGFMASIKPINYLKLRASFGTVGNQSIPNTAARPVLFPTSYNGQTGFFSGLSNPDLKWEETEKINIGLDIRMLNDRLAFNIDAYNEQTNDLFLSVPLSRTTGFNSQLQNIGSLRNRGLEVNISTKNIDYKGFKWESGFNIAFNKTTVLKLSNGESFRQGRFLIEEGEEYGVFNLVRRAGVNPANGRFLWYDKDGNLTEEFDENNAVNTEPSIPKYHGGFTNTFSLGPLELRTAFTFAQGHSIYNVVRTSLDNPTKISRGSVSTNALRFWRQPGDITDLPDPGQVSNYFTDSGWLEDASYIKLRNVVLSFNLPKDVTENLNISNLRIYLQGQNLYTWTSFTGLDPENSSSNFVADYPSLSTYSLGLDVRF